MEQVAKMTMDSDLKIPPVTAIEAIATRCLANAIRASFQDEILFNAVIAYLYGEDSDTLELAYVYLVTVYKERGLEAIKRAIRSNCYLSGELKFMLAICPDTQRLAAVAQDQQERYRHIDDIPEGHC